MKYKLIRFRRAEYPPEYKVVGSNYSIYKANL